MGPQPPEPARPRTFDETWTRLRVPMLQLATMLVDRHDIAEDVVQDAFLNLHRRWGSVADPAAYLRVSVVNGSRSVLRRRRLARLHLALSFDAPAAVATTVEHHAVPAAPPLPDDTWAVAPVGPDRPPVLPDRGPRRARALPVSVAAVIAVIAVIATTIGLLVAHSGSEAPTRPGAPGGTTSTTSAPATGTTGSTVQTSTSTAEGITTTTAAVPSSPSR